MGALASSGSPQGGVGEGLELPPIWAQSRPGWLPKNSLPSLQGPLPHLIYRTPLLPAPLGCREPGKGGEGGGAGQLGPSYLLLPTGCLFAVPGQSDPPTWPRLRRKRQVRGPHSLGLQRP